MCSAVLKGLRYAYTQESFLMLGNVHIWVVPPCNVVELLILKNRFFRLRNVQIWVSSVLEVGRSADFHEFCFHAAKRSDMYCDEMQGCLFADCQVWHFQDSKRSDNCSTTLQEGRFARAHE